MPKILRDSEYNSLKQKADNYDAVVTGIVAANDGLTAEEVTPEVITEAINASGSEDNSTELQTQLDAAVERAETAESRVTGLETENANLRGSAAGESAQVTTKVEPAGENETIAAFADSHAGDTAAIWEQAKKEGLIN